MVGGERLVTNLSRLTLPATLPATGMFTSASFDILMVPLFRALNVQRGCTDGCSFRDKAPGHSSTRYRILFAALSPALRSFTAGDSHRQLEPRLEASVDKGDGARTWYCSEHSNGRL